MEIHLGVGSILAQGDDKNWNAGLAGECPRRRRFSRHQDLQVRKRSGYYIERTTSRRIQIVAAGPGGRDFYASFHLGVCNPGDRH